MDKQEPMQNEIRTTSGLGGPLSLQTGDSVGSLTFGKFQKPEGQVMKLHLVNIQPEEVEATQPEAETQLFGTHLREAIAIVKDWKDKR